MVLHAHLRIGWLLMLLMLLTSCATPPTYASVAATAQVAGCWPGTVATPNPVTITPSAPIPVGMTPTALPTTTPYPYCAGTLLTPLPSPVPAPKPYPTMERARSRSQSDAQTTFELPGTTYQLDLAVHPTENWPVVAAMQQWSLGTDGTQVFVRVFNPVSQRWNTAQQVDVGAASTGHDRFASIAVAVTGDRVVHAAWGSTDGTGAIWTGQSADYGVTWSAPVQVAKDCWDVHGMAASADGQIVILASCYTGSGGNLVSRANLIVRGADGSWHAPESVGAPGWFGAVVVVGDGAEARAVAMTTDHANPTDTAYLISGRLSGGGWTVQTRHISVAGAYHLHQRGIAFGERGVVFTWHGQYRANAGALISLDAGQSWGNTDTVFGGDASTHAEDAPGMYVTPAYDIRANRLVALWTEQGTHAGAWSTPGSGTWTRIRSSSDSDAGPMPLVTGATDAVMTAGAQTAGNGHTWLAWVDRNHQISVRSEDLTTLIPVGQYPPATPVPADDPTPGGGA